MLSDISRSTRREALLFHFFCKPESKERTQGMVDGARSEDVIRITDDFNAERMSSIG